tara:strand:+ start:31 stop:204 length:174 start_codon:yes stop_codon:yes gene_type:complete
MKGLGDLIYFITKYTGIRWIWKKINPDCGCEERQEKFNKAVPFRKPESIKTPANGNK